MDLKMMKTSELARAITEADNEHWHYRELLDLRCEEQAEDRSMRYVNDYEYDQEIDELDAMAGRALDRLAELQAERERRLYLSNHARLAEAAMRGEVPA